MAAAQMIVFCKDFAGLTKLFFLRITRTAQQAVVMISLEDYNALEETASRLRNPANARTLLESIAERESGRGTERELVG